MADIEVSIGADRRQPFRHRLVQEVFEDRAAATPDTDAVDGPHETLTYRTLNERANSLARLLQEHGAGPEVVVGLYLPRGADFVVAQLANLKAGAAYLPLDVGDPPARTEEMLRAAGASLLVTSEGQRGRLGNEAPRTLVIDDLDLSERAGDNPRTVVDPANLAYVVFTSGSTGRPKPVAVTHGALANHLYAIRDRYGLTTVDRVLQFANPAFDVVAEEVFPTLGAGGCVVIAPGPAMAPAAFQRFLDSEGVTVANLPTSYWTQWTLELEALGEPPPSCLRLLVVGTEKAPARTLARWWTHADVPVVNAYGLSETTVTVTSRTFLPGDVPGTETLPVGTPIAQCEAFVYDARLQRAPLGTSGELWIGGAALGRGYPGLPALTAERFLPHPERPGALLFRTGDLARVLPDGEIEILGRVDRQLKIRGHRVEPSEIEIALRSHPDVGHSYVRAESDPAREGTQLVAYVTPADIKRVPSARSLREGLRGAVPDYMLPAGYVVLPALPLRPNGKVDADALPDPDPLRRRVTNTFTGPRTEIERWLVDVWQEILFVGRVGIDDDFFELGGHSLSAMQVVARVRSATGIELSVPQVISTTPRLLALEIESLRTVPGRPGLPSIEPRAGETTAPLSFQQEQVWFHTKLAPESIAYQTQTTIRVVGPLDLEVFGRAVTEMVKRHEILRTVYREVDGQPEQVVLPPEPAPVTHLDLSALPPDQVGAELEAITRDELQSPFDLSRLPLMRWTVVRLGPEEYELVLVEHHMVHDGWSFALLMRELTIVYGAFAHGQESPLEELPFQYRDYARWEREAIHSEAMLARRATWAEKLQGITRSPELPADRKRREVQRFVGDALRADLPPGLPACLRDYCREERVTPFAAMFAAFALLVSRYSGESDVAISSAFANRNVGETDRLIGMFVNPVLLRCDLEGVPTFRDLTRQASDVVLSAMQNQEFPFAEVVRMLNPARDATRNPLVDLMFSFNDAPLSQIDFAGASGTVFEATNESSKTDLNVVVMPRAESGMGDTDRIDDRITLLWEYNSDVFDAVTIERLASHYGQVLEAVTADPSRPLSEVDVMSAAERHHVVVELNDTADDFPADRCIHELFEAQVLKTPDALALVTEDDELTYRELNAAANRFAHHLVHKGVGPEVRVGICLERGADLVVGLLAVLKAGGAYVPLDPDYPPERLAFMLEDTAAPVVVTSSELAGRLDNPRAELVLADADQEVISTHPGTNPAPSASPRDLAYVIYTSGSTGTPKGVMVAHRGVCNRLVWMQREYGLGADDAVLQKTPFTFDVSVWELFAPLITGARLVMARPGGHKDPLYLADTIHRHGISVVHFVPSMLVAYLAQGPARHDPRLTICSGEALSPQTVKDFKERFDGELHNLYGPTEASIEVTFYGCEDDGADTVPIGRPIANTAIYILDAYGSPAPKGVPGELYIGGTGVVRGYLNRPALTAERFVPDPFSRVAGARLYRTGDRARWLHDGNVEFLGRVDHQVKIRGFRIEPGEIEACLTAHEAVRDAVVVPARGEDGADTRLVAYVVGDGALPTTTELRSHLSKSLPDYMVPAYFVVMDELPLSSSGKLDRASLPAPEGRRELEAVYAAPRTPAEKALTRIWCEVLGLERVGIHDNFYELGGDSILSIQIVARANAVGLGLTPRLLFQHQSVAALAAVAGTRSEVSAEQGPVRGEVALTPIQRWFFERDLPERHHFNQSRLLNAGTTDPELVQKALAALVDHHDALRLRFVPDEDGWTQHNAAAEEAGYFSVTDLGGLDEAEQERALEATCGELQASLDLEHGPLVRAAWFDLGERGARLFLCIHHLAVDGVSWRILLEDLDSAYDRLHRGEPIRLAPKTTSFRQWAERLVAYASSEEALSELDYWAEHVANSFELPVDHNLGPNDEASTEEITVALGAPETEALLQEVPAAYRTHINDVLVAALARAISSWTGSERIAIDLEGHGREDLFDGVDLTRTVGWFTSLFPVALQVDTAEPSALLKAIKEQLRALPSRGLGYGVLRYLAPEDVRARVASPAPLSFNYLGRFGQEANTTLFSPVAGPTRPGRARSGDRTHVIEVDSRVSAGSLHMTWTYSRNLHRRATIERVATGFLAALRELIAHCSYERAGGVTPSDFPLADLDQRTLDELWSKGLVDRTTQDVYALTPLQQGMVFHTLYEPASAVYFQQWTFTLTGPLDAGAFEQAWRETCAAHDALRSAVLGEGLKVPVQVVRRDVAPPFEEHDWRDLDPTVQQERLDAYLVADRARGVDLAAAPLMRIALLRTGSRSSVFVWSFHHVLLDGWSAALVRAEVLARYHALVRGETHEVAAAPPYRDYIEWLNERDGAGDERYWRDRLAGFAAPTPLLDDGGSGSGDLRRYALELDEDTTAALDGLARRERLTLNTIVQAAWALLLSRYSDENDVVFGATVSGRPPELAGVQETIGLFINTVPVRVGIDGSASAREWLGRVQADAVERGPFEHSALTDIHSWSEVPRGTSLFDSIVVFENYPRQAAPSPSDTELTISDLGGFERTNYPLTLVVRPGASLSFEIVCDRGRLRPATVERMAGHLQNLLKAVASDPGRPVSELELLSQAERHHLVVELNDTSVEYRDTSLVHELFEARVLEDPDAVALMFGDEELSYGELNAAANRLAHHLVDKGVCPDVPVGVCLERGPDLVVGLLAVFKAGGVYVPLDPGYPAERLAFMLRDTSAPVVVTTSQIAGRLDTAAELVLLDADRDVISARPDTDPGRVASLYDLAYVIYTSGSTGTPKGVGVAHRSLGTHCMAIADRYELTGADRVLVFGSFSFDVSLEQTLSPLIKGASVVLRDADVWDPETLAGKVDALGITVLNPPTAYWHQLAGDREVVERLSASSSLRLVAAGGEAMATSRLRQWLEASDGLELLNNYGPTEATITATSYAVAEPVLVGDAELKHTAAGYPETRLVHELFEARVQANPDAVALSFGDHELSYLELNRQANRLAHHLVDKGVGPDVPVGVCLERGLGLVVGLLAILKAGGAYVPLDPDYPTERLAFILEDTAAPVVVATAKLAGRLATYGGELVLTDAEDDVIAARPDSDPAVGASSEFLAYVIYTSGSTGTPKGVAVTHANVVRLVTADYVDVSPQDVFLQFAPVSFDASTFELWVPLLHGARIAIADPGVVSPEEIAEIIERHGVTVAWLTASLFNAVIDAVPASLRQVRQLLAGGDALSPSHVAKALERLPETRLVNGYGPTESTTFACCYDIDALSGDASSVPIGRPISNTTVYILDRYGNPVPKGVPGELYIGGAGVARGYVNRPALTAEHFVPDPFASIPGARLYRTGDRARYLSDGNIEFLGRVDHQVKIRGFRIEPGEIEACLVAHEAITDAVVVARVDGGDKRLVAYVVGNVVTTTELRAHVSKSLPDYMVPAFFVVLDELPLTPNGKLDRAALPAPEGRPELEAVYVAPRTPAEEVLAGIWCEVLGLERVGIHDNFFELGGHSLIATQVVSRARDAFSVELQLKGLFESPTVAQLATLVADGERRDVPAIEPVPRTGELPLSFAQQRLWFLDQLEPGSAEYNIPHALRVRGTLDVEALGRALSDVVARHETLRTTFATVDGEPVQVIRAPGDFAVEVTDLSHLDGDKRELEAQRIAAAEASRPFDFEHGPLLRARVLRLDSSDHVLLMNMHHIVSDGWSRSVLLGELSTLYEAHVSGETASLPELAVQYADFAAWQRRWLSGDVLQGQLDYWRERLAGLAPVLELPTDHPRPAVRSGRGATVSFDIDAGTLAALKALGRAHNATLFMTLTAAFQALLSRYSGSDDVAVGTPIAGRSHPEAEPLIGFFVNTLVLRTDLSGDPSFVELVGRVRDVALGAYAHQDVPFEKLVEELHPQRSLSHTPLFQVMFALDNTAEGALALGDATVARFPVDYDASKFDLQLALRDAGGEVEGDLQYSTDLFDAATVERMAGHLQNLLKTVASDPYQALSELDVMSAPERHHVVVELNDTAAGHPGTSLVNELFEAQVLEAPDSIALVTDGDELTYRELNAAANRFAHHLADKGVGPDVPVGICLERGPDLVVGLLAILKAGGAYVPLDPDYPTERLAFMLQDTAAPVVVTTSELAGRLDHEGTELVLLDADDGVIAACPDTNPARVASSEDLAYVIYTSGSTGTPKGVAVTHANVVRLVTADYVDVSPQDVFLQFAPVSFDASTFELWVPLLHGARIAIADPGVVSPEEIAEIIERHGVTVAWLTASLFNAVIDAVPASLRQVRQLLAGGDALSPSHVAKALERLPETRLVNGYGPTESTTFTCCYDISDVSLDASSVPIGRPIANTAVYILDAYGNPVPKGVAGELYVGGAGVARGYVKRPALTAERFVPDAFSGVAGARLYRTGDRARYLADGNIEFLGRVDHQVKIRGFRIEPGEIEACLVAHEAIRDAVVLARSDGGDKRLVAYVVGNAVTTTELRAHVSKSLPDYMVPAFFVVLDELPLTPNGKLDRAALPAPEGRPELEAMYVAPRTPAEEVLAGIWCEVLGLERVGIHDNFFELGGHSLIATQVVSRARDAFSVELALRALFESSTVAELAARVAHSDRRDMPAIEPVPRTGELPLSFAQQRLWFLDQLEPGSAEYNIPHALRVHGKLDVEALGRALSDVVARHETLRTTFATVDGEPVQVIGAPEPIALEVTELNHLDGDKRELEAQRIGAAEASRAFDLERGPLLRARVLRLDSDDHVVLLNMHHIVSDGWSRSVLLGELSTLYEGYVSGERAELSELSVQYADFAAWQRRWLSGDVLEGQLDYWRERLAGLAPVLELPTDRPRPAVKTSHGETHSFLVDPDTMAALNALGRAHNATLFMTLTAAFQTLLSRYSGSDDIAIGTPIAGRTRAEIEDLVGFFVNTLVLRTDLSGDPSFVELVGRVRDVALGAYAHQDVPFEKLVEELHPQRSLSHTPLFQVMLSLDNTAEGALTLGDAAVARFPADYIASKFDLTLSVIEDDAGAEGIIAYNADLFEPATVERMCGHLQNLLKAVASDAGRPLSELDLLSQPERHHLVVELNDTQAAYSDTDLVHERFEDQVRENSGAVALAFGDHELSYAELNAAANRLAHHLVDKGVGPEVPVGICLERGSDLVVGLLAVLKAGGAYLPLDPDYPTERLAFMLEDTAAPVMVTTSELAGRLDQDVALVLLDADAGVIAAYPDTNPARVVSSEDLAYVIYTSGSTGAPKGVAVTHGSLGEHCTTMADHYALTPADRVLVFGSFNFDVSLEQTLTPLTRGASVVVRDAGVWEPETLVDNVASFGITMLNPPTAYWHQLAGNREVVERLCGSPSLRLVAAGGEAMASSRLRQWLEASDGRPALLNNYGPTEATITATSYPVTEPDAVVGETVPIGRPIANTTVYILDAYGNPVPKGVVGELYIGGAGVARGYVKRPALTAERFVPDAFSGVAGARLYRTGDRARYLADGDIEFLGRVDHQVKIRGFRIEPGEIEACLVAHEAIRDAVVVARSDDGDKRLVAYVVGEGVPTTTELRAFVGRSLPDYMVPAFFVVLDELPLTPNGKLDRAALPAPEGRPELDAVYAAPRTPAEEVLAGIWCEVLGLERVGIHDNFFELGGHSLIATQVVSRMRAILDVDARVRSLFEAPTVEALAAHVEELILAEVEALPATEVTRELAEMGRASDEDEETT